MTSRRYEAESVGSLRHENSVLRHEVQQLRDKVRSLEEQNVFLTRSARDAWAETRLARRARPPRES